MNILKARNITKSYNGTIVVNKVNLDIEDGKIYALLGPNGAGKTTLMSMFLNLVSPDFGEIFIFSKKVELNKFNDSFLNNSSNRKIYSKVGSIIETPSFYQNLNAYENLKIIANLHENISEEDIINALKLVGLDSVLNKKFKNYSLGMKQKLAIANAIIHKPKLLILDEPINALDPMGVVEFRNLLLNLVKKFNISVLISSHILSEIENIADIFLIMDNGIIIEELSKEDLHKKLKNYVEFEVSDLNLATKILNKRGLKEGVDFEIFQNSIRLLTNFNSRAEINKLFVQSDIEVYKVNLNEELLEEYFLNTFGFS